MRASKIASLVVGVMFLLTLWWGKRDWLTILTILIATGLIVACWFIAHGVALRFYMLFLGVMNSCVPLSLLLEDLVCAARTPSRERRPDSLSPSLTDYTRSTTSAVRPSQLTSR